ncbi:Cytochrome b2, mitochondrial precursor [Elasticomyces elasticus]|nr:Cytochrome b2, mitochondrial precursor [Elasticomyces elasticus]
MLLECHRLCPEIFSKLEVYVDGGIRRGTDILKCLCLGATAVGLGRPFLYALNYGQEGVEHYIDILRDELETSMRLIGITDLSQVRPGLVNTAAVDHLVDSTEDHPWIQWRPTARL